LVFITEVRGKRQIATPFCQANALRAIKD